MRKLISVVILSALVGALLVIASPARATTRTGLQLIAPNFVVQRSYPALTPGPARQGTATVNPLVCKDPAFTYCDQIKLEINPAGKYFLYNVKVSLSWPNPKTKGTNETGNDLTIGVWEPNPAEVDLHLRRKNKRRVDWKQRLHPPGSGERCHG